MTTVYSHYWLGHSRSYGPLYSNISALKLQNFVSASFFIARYQVLSLEGRYCLPVQWNCIWNWLPVQYTIPLHYMCCEMRAHITWPWASWHITFQRSIKSHIALHPGPYLYNALHDTGFNVGYTGRMFDNYVIYWGANFNRGCTSYGFLRFDCFIDDIDDIWHDIFFCVTIVIIGWNFGRWYIHVCLCQMTWC